MAKILFENENLKVQKISENTIKATIKKDKWCLYGFDLSRCKIYIEDSNFESIEFIAKTYREIEEFFKDNNCDVLNIDMDFGEYYTEIINKIIKDNQSKTMVV